MKNFILKLLSYIISFIIVALCLPVLLLGIICGFVIILLRSGYHIAKGFVDYVIFLIEIERKKKETKETQSKKKVNIVSMRKKDEKSDQ